MTQYAAVMRVRGVLETVLYAGDVPAAAAFYREVFGFTAANEVDEESAALRVSTSQVLLIFNPDHSERAGRIVPSHGARGAGHVAFTINPGDFDGWLGRLSEVGVEVEHEHTWANGERSIYVRDPAGNSVELMTGDIWGGSEPL